MIVKCTECGVSCDNSQLLLRHHRYHHGEKIKCEYCSFVVSRHVLYKMKDHYRRRHHGKEFRQVGQGKSSLSKAHSQRRSPSWGGLKSVGNKIMGATQSPRLQTPERSPLTSVGSTPVTHLRSYSPVYLGDFPTIPAMVAMVPPTMRNSLKSPVKKQPKGTATPTPFTETSSGVGDALSKPSSGNPVSPSEPAGDPENLHNLPPYNPTIMESAQQPSSPPRRVELWRPVPTYLVKPINMEMTRQGAVYKYTNRLPSLHYAHPREAFVGDPRIYPHSPQAECLRRLTMKATSFGQLSNSHHFNPSPQVWLKRVEKAVLPDETVNMLTSTWFPDPAVSKMKIQCTMTEDERSLTRHMETQTEEFSLSTSLSSKSTEEKETQCSIFSLNLN